MSTALIIAGASLAALAVVAFLLVILVPNRALPPVLGHTSIASGGLLNGIIDGVAGSALG